MLWGDISPPAAPPHHPSLFLHWWQLQQSCTGPKRGPAAGVLPAAHTGCFGHSAQSLQLFSLLVCSLLSMSSTITMLLGNSTSFSFVVGESSFSSPFSAWGQKNRAHYLGCITAGGGTGLTSSPNQFAFSSSLFGLCPSPACKCTWSLPAICSQQLA